jgi:CrcB protein
MMYLMIALGGALGALARFLVSGWFISPLGTLAVNVVGSFIMGLAFVFFSSRGLDRVMFFAMTGFLGAFTTFSAFSLDVFKLIETERMTEAVGYVAVSVIGAVVALFMGVFLAKGVLS